MNKKLNIEGMSCENCVNHTTEALKKVDGVTQVTVDLASKSANVTVSPQVTDALIKQAVTDAGYEVTSIIAED